MLNKKLKYFWDKVEKTDSCWFWRGGISSRGYGNFAFRKDGIVVNNRAHRFSFELAFGKIPKNILVCHKCDNPLCVNPQHLFLGTQKDNAIDMVKKGRANPLKGEKSNLSKLKEYQVIEIRNLYNFGKKRVCELAELFNISHQQISKIILGQRWKYLIQKTPTRV